MNSRPEFGPQFDRLLTRAGSGETAAFGRDVLSALVEPLKAAAALPRTDRRWGPGVLGCAMWMDDPELIQTLATMANVCVIITKQQTRKYTDTKFEQLRELARNSGLAQSAYPELGELAPREDGQPRVVGPHSPPLDSGIGGVRELGFRKVGARLVPIVHAKILLLGQMCWTDEHPSGDVVDQLFFVPERLWIGSANFTMSSRHSLEVGLWTLDRELLTAARKWLLHLVAQSEPLETVSDEAEPDLLPVAYDDTAFAEYFHGLGPDSTD